MDIGDVRTLTELYEEYEMLKSAVTYSGHDYLNRIKIITVGGNEKANININHDYFNFILRLRIEILEAYFKYYNSNIGLDSYGNFVANYMNKGGFMYDNGLMTSIQYKDHMDAQMIERSFK